MPERKLSRAVNAVCKLSNNISQTVGRRSEGKCTNIRKQIVCEFILVSSVSHSFTVYIVAHTRTQLPSWKLKSLLKIKSMTFCFFVFIWMVVVVYLMFGSLGRYVALDSCVHLCEIYVVPVHLWLLHSACSFPFLDSSVASCLTSPVMRVYPVHTCQYH
jgi:hypothetical protein